MSEETRIIEVAGVKLEIDLRQAKKVENYRVGDRVKVLKKKYSDDDDYVVHPGVIIGFENFEKLPTIVVAYLVKEYSSLGVEFGYINEKTEKIEICPAVEETLEIDKAWAIQQLDEEIRKKRNELQSLEERKKLFVDQFGAFFGDGTETATS
jgi:hypothetical protein